MWAVRSSPLPVLSASGAPSSLFGRHWGWRSVTWVTLEVTQVTDWFVVQTQFETISACHQNPKLETEPFGLHWKFPNQNRDRQFQFGLNRVWVSLRPNFPNTNANITRNGRWQIKQKWLWLHMITFSGPELVMDRSGSEPWFEPEPMGTEPWFGSRFEARCEPDLKSGSTFSLLFMVLNPFGPVWTNR